MNYDNKELKEIMNYVKEKPVFFLVNGNECRLLSKEEINDYKTHLQTNIDNIVPLIDLMDNNFIVYVKEENNFKILNITDDILYKNVEHINSYIERIKLEINK